MNNVLPFPSAEKALWDTVKIGVTKRAEKAGASHDEIETFLENFQPIFELFLFDYQLQFPTMDAPIAQALMLEMTKFQTALKEHITKLLFDRLMFEMQRVNW